MKTFTQQACDITFDDPKQLGIAIADYAHLVDASTRLGKVVQDYAPGGVLIWVNAAPMVATVAAVHPYPMEFTHDGAIVILAIAPGEMLIGQKFLPEGFSFNQQFVTFSIRVTSAVTINSTFDFELCDTVLRLL